MASGLIDWVVGPPLPAEWSLARRRDHSTLLGTAIAAATIHAGLLVVFAVLGVWPMAWFNIGSVAAWSLAVMLVRGGRPGASLALGFAEIIGHALFGTYVLGWDAQLHYALPIMAAICIAFGRVARGLRWIAPLAGVAAWIGAFLFLSERPPMFQLSHALVRGFMLASGLEMFTLTAALVVVLTRAAELAEEHLALEHERSERLVHNMLPVAIASRLKGGEAQIADRVDEASILFADLVGFTVLSATARPDELVLALNDVFMRFDALVEKHGLEKIKTIGDAYMVAAGVPRPRTDHAQALANFALDLTEMLKTLAPFHGTKLSMRIGINSGAVVAGVIGKTKPAYDLWGDTVNTAARMESHGEAGRIHVSRAVREHLGAAYEFESRGVIEVKGKGPMETFFLVGSATGLGPPPAG